MTRTRYCPGLPDHTAVLAARFFDEHQAVADQRAGIPAWSTQGAKQSYIATVAADPQAAHALAVMYGEVWPEHQTKQLP